MNILVIGNGFDLAHNLPTKYSNFLSWIRITRKIIDENYTLKEDDWENIDSRIRASMEDGINRGNNLPFFLQKEWQDIIVNNVLINYFFSFDQCESWIDFETEMSKLIQVLDVLDEKIDIGDSLNNLKKSDKKIIEKICPGYHYGHFRKELLEKLQSNELISNFNNLDDILGVLGVYKKFEEVNMMQVEKAFDDNMSSFGKDLEGSLNDLIKLLEKYLSFFCLNFVIDKVSPEIKEINADKVLSFNYTNTYERVYGGEDRKKTEYDYIHGKVQSNCESNNLVLGIDEYLPIDKKDCNLKFIAFKKYYQRIYKGTGNAYKNWLYKIKEDARELKSELHEDFPLQVPIEKFKKDKRHNLYIFGHSLDATDRDILRELILNDNVYTTIYYYSEDGKNKSDLAAKVTNLVKVIGQDELIRRTSGITKTIDFVQQAARWEWKTLG